MKSRGCPASVLVIPLPTFFSDDPTIPECVRHFHIFVAVNIVFPFCSEHMPSDLKFPRLSVITPNLGLYHSPLVSFPWHSCVCLQSRLPSFHVSV